MKKCWQIIFAVGVIVLATVGCRLSPSEPRELNLYPSPTVLATQTPIVVIHTSTPLPTLTPVYIQITNTPEQVLAKCVLANVAVHLRPSPSTENYPIQVLANGQKVTDLGGRTSKWWFVSVG